MPKLQPNRLVSTWWQLWRLMSCVNLSELIKFSPREGNYSVKSSPLFIVGLRFLKNHKRVGSSFLVKMGNSLYRGMYKEWGKHCFSLIIYAFCCGNALCTESLSSRMFTFLLIPFGTWDRYYFGSNLSLVLLIKVLLKGFGKKIK